MRRHLMSSAAVAALAALPFTSVAGAAKPENAGNSSDAGKPADVVPAKPDRAGKPDNPGHDPAGPGNSDSAPGHTETGTVHAPGQNKDAEAVLQGRDTAPAGDPAHTALGETVGATPAGGTVRVKAPGTDEYVELTADQPVPVGTLVDARSGALEIGSETVAGVEQHAVVGGALFQVEQDPKLKGVTDLTLRGGDFGDCRSRRPTREGKAKGKSRTTARAAARKRKAKGDGVVRGLWGSGKGRFRTRGLHSTASVRGTHWITVDRCHSTTVRVLEGLVDVTDEATGKVYPVAAGERRVVRAPAWR